MKSRKLLFAGALASIICGGAHARGIAVDGWAFAPGGGNGLTATVNPNAPPAGPALVGIQSLSFSTGTSILGYDVATFTPAVGFNLSRYEWSAPGGGVEQVIIDNPGTGSFSVSFGYSSGTDDLGNANGSAPAGNLPEVARLSVNGVTYKTFVAPNSLNPDMSGAHDDSVFDFSNGKLTNGADIARGWSRTATSAPEIDPASSASALTVLGVLAILSGSPKRRKRKAAPNLI